MKTVLMILDVAEKLLVNDVERLVVGIGGKDRGTRIVQRESGIAVATVDDGGWTRRRDVCDVVVVLVKDTCIVEIDGVVVGIVRLRVIEFQYLVYRLQTITDIKKRKNSQRMSFYF